MQKKVYDIEEAKRKAEYYCSYQERCHKEVENKLYKMGLIKDIRDHILEHLLEYDFLNEERFAMNFVHGKFNIKKYGKVRLLRELKHKGISEYCINKAIKQIDNNEYLKTLKNIFDKKMEILKELPEKQKQKKIFNHLIYKGFEVNLIKHLFQIQSKFSSHI